MGGIQILKEFLHFPFQGVSACSRREDIDGPYASVNDTGLMYCKKQVSVLLLDFS